MKRYLLWFLIIGITVSMLITFSLISCKKEATSTETTSAETTVGSTAAAETTAAETMAAGEPKTIVYWSMFNEDEADAKVIKYWIEEYKKIRPEITINVNFVGREVLTKVMAARGGNEVIDIIDTESFALKGSLIKEGLALPLDEALGTPNYEGDKTWKDTFISGTLEQYADGNGKISIIPYELFSSGFAYDQKLWQDNGWNVPKTWDDFLALCETIKTTSKIAPLTQDAGVDFYNDIWFYQIMEKLNGPGSILAAAQDPTGEKWEDPSFKKAIEIERELFDKGYIIAGAEGFVWPQGQLLLASREAAMELCGNWLHAELKDQVDKDFKWGYFPFPEIAGGKGKITDLESYLVGWAIFNDTKVGPEAIEFLKYATSKANAQYFVDNTKFASTVKDITPPEELGELGTGFQSATALFSSHDGLPEQYPDYYKNVYLKNHNLAFLGKITPDEFSKVMKEETIKFWKNQ